MLFNVVETEAATRGEVFGNITAQIHLLDIMLSDARAFVEAEREIETFRVGAEGQLDLSKKVKRVGPIQLLIDGLQALHDTISQFPPCGSPSSG
jgi:hypothetical protein